MFVCIYIFSRGACIQKTQLGKVTIKQNWSFIPAYKEDSVIVDVAVKALTQEYPREV